MSDLMDKLAYLQETKALLKAKLGVGDSVPFRDYVAVVPKATSWTQAAYEATKSQWVRPANWLAMPSMVQGDQKVAILMPVYDDDASYATLTLAGAYTVDWGDGTVENFASGVAANHKYAYSALADSTLTSEGFKQALIVATPQVGVDMTSVALNGNTSIGKPSRYLDVKMAGKSIATLTVSNLPLMQEFEYIGSNSISGFSSMFSVCSMLASVPQFDTSKGTDFSGMFYGCSTLVSIPQLDTSRGTMFSQMFCGCTRLTTIPLLDTSNGTTFSTLFSNCSALTVVPLMDTRNGTNFSGMFYSCYALASVPQLDTSNGTNFSAMFQACYALATIPQLDTSKGTDFSGMFYGCSALASVPQLDTSKGTNFSSMFANCGTLTSVPQLDTSNGTNFSSMFVGCRSLMTISQLDTSNGTNFSDMFYYCRSLTVIPQLSTSNGMGFSDIFTTVPLLSRSKLTGVKYAISYASCSLSRQGILEIFNNLGTASGTQTVTVTGNPGTASLTAADKAIATAKGWTVAA